MGVWSSRRRPQTKLLILWNLVNYSPNHEEVSVLRNCTHDNKDFMLIWPKNVFWPFLTLVMTLSKNSNRVDSGLIQLNLTSSFEFAYSNFLTQKWATPLLFFEFQGPIPRPRSVSEWKFWCDSTQFGELFRMTYWLSKSESV